MDIFSDKNIDKKVETSRFGHFKFTVGLDFEQIEILFKRLEDAQTRFKSSPLASIANNLEEEVVVSSVFGTNTIEQGRLSEEQIRLVFQKSPDEIQTEQEIRVVNIRDAYDYIKQIGEGADWEPNITEICHIHELIYSRLTDDSGEKIKAGVLRDNPKEIKTIVGNKEHGGPYKPPQFIGDIRLLLDSLLSWNEELINVGIPALIRAPLIHFYFELIHPFNDGNGRVGRVLEAGILYSDGFRYAPFAQANYYLKHIHKYFALFNECRRQAQKKRACPNQQFVQFFLEGMFETINNLHDKVNILTNIMMFQFKLKSLFDDKHINKRQYEIMNKISAGGALSKKDLFLKSWYIELYAGLTDKTRQRDLRKLKDIKLLSADKNGRFILYGMPLDKP